MCSNIQDIYKEQLEFSRHVTHIGRFRALIDTPNNVLHYFPQYYRRILNDESSLHKTHFNNHVSPKTTAHLPVTFALRTSW
jgi:hypothetical protein